MSDAFRLTIASSEGIGRVWIYRGDDIVVGLRVDTKKRRWIATYEDAAGIEGLADFIHDQAGKLDEAGFNVRRWWHLWRCWDCGALPLDSCRHATKGTPNRYCHKGRKPRGVRP